jgi:5-dehydro-2-deoxygluconokinase
MSSSVRRFCATRLPRRLRERRGCRAQAGRNQVGCIILGRGEDDAKVREWPGIAAAVPGFIGFAVGRTSFWDPLVNWLAEKVTRDQAVDQISARYREFVTIFETHQKAVTA